MWAELIYERVKYIMSMGYMSYFSEMSYITLTLSPDKFMYKLNNSQCLCTFQQKLFQQQLVQRMQIRPFRGYILV